MIITRTPLRISFLGGGSDLPAFCDEEEGIVVGSAIQKYIYINVNYKFDEDVRVSYSKSEIVSNTKYLQHDIAREILLDYKIENHFEVSSMSDVPSNGTGMGSSSSYCVGLLNAVHYYQKEKPLAPGILAQKSCFIEIDKLGKPIGKQDQYFAAYGGLVYMNFKGPDVSVSKIKCSNETYNNMQENLFLVYTGINRSANDILSVQKTNTINKRETKRAIKDMVGLARILIKDISNNNLSNFGRLLDESWHLKKQYTETISNKTIDDIYLLGKNSGALGGKLLGAGGGGFILFYVEKSEHDKFLKEMSSFKMLPVQFAGTGSEIIFKK